MGQRLDAIVGLLQRYGAVFWAAWKVRGEMEGPQRLPHEAQFLPAHLELQETPPSPAPRVLAWLVMLFFLLAVVWAAFGRIDIVAVAQGRILPGDRSKVIQPLEPATIARIYVHDGQPVRKGDPLIDLDATQADADFTRTRDQLRDARLAALRARALLGALDRATLPRLPAVPDIDQSAWNAEQQLLTSQYLEFRSKQATFDSELARREAELDTTREAVAKLEQVLPLISQRADDYKNLQQQNFVSRHRYLEQEQNRIETERDLAAQRSHVRELAAAIEEARRNRAAAVAEFRRTVLDQLADAEQKSEALQQENIKAGQRQRLTRLTAPVDGTVQQLAVHTVGGVVTEAQALMVIVPRDNPVEIEAWLENRDIGFVWPRQAATVKVETFPYTRYGVLTGEVVTVSSDAVQDEKRGLIYQTRISLQRSTLNVDGREVRLSPGMAVTVEVKTGQRRILEYFLAPLIQHASESLRER